MAREMPQLEGVEHRYATVGGLRLHYAEAGEGKPLLLVHGWPQHWWMWRHQLVPLAEAGHRVICPDLRGYGWSDKPRSSYRKDEFMVDMLGLLDELGLDRVIWVGHDWGAYTGMLAALGHPERIERLAALSIPHPWLRRRFDPGLLRSSLYQLPLAAPVLGKLGVRRLGIVRRALSAGRAHGRYSEEELAIFEDPFRERDGAEASMRTYRSFVIHEALQWPAGSFRDQRLTVPTLWMVGDRDPVGRHADDGILDHADDIELVRIPGAGHFLPEEMPDVVLERVLEFLSAGAAPASA